jgi:hypothetical protein
VSDDLDSGYATPEAAALIGWDTRYARVDKVTYSEDGSQARVTLLTNQEPFIYPSTCTAFATDQDSGSRRTAATSSQGSLRNAGPLEVALLRVEHADRETVVALLAPLARVEPVRRRTRSRHRRAVVGATGLAFAAILVGGAAVAATSWGPLAGIGAAERPARPTDTLPPAVLAQLRADERPPGTGPDRIGRRLVDQARLLGSLPDGHNVYAVPTTTNRLCIVVANLTESCGDALTHARPITFTVVEPGPGVPPVVWGATANNVASVDFQIGVEDVTAPVHNNFYAWQGTVAQAQASVSKATVTFTDGSQQIAD